MRADDERPDNPLVHAVGDLSDTQIRRLAALLRLGEGRDRDSERHEEAA
ncbi:hypothetical protein GCM10010228_15220 [Streptomyces massasporeus]|nr:hypothetical protein GCM10010228_15220 [Streptomyces massasporeus]